MDVGATLARINYVYIYTSLDKSGTMHYRIQVYFHITKRKPVAQTSNVY